MARAVAKQATFARGVASGKLHGRNDLDLYFSALRDGKNYVVDGHGILEKRPGTMFIASTKDDGEAVFIPFAYSTTQAYVLEFGEEYVRAFSDYAAVLDGGSEFEETTPYTIEEARVLSYVQSNDVLFLVHENHAPARLIRTSASTFALSTFDTYDGPYEDTNTDPDSLMALTTSGSDRLLTSSGANATEFTADMVGRWIRLQTTNTDGDDNELGDEFLWDFFQITEYVSSTQVKVNSTGGDVTTATTFFRLGAFYEGSWPQAVTLQSGRLVLAKGNTVYWSKPYDFNNFAPGEHTVNGGATNSAGPSSAIIAVIDSGLTQTGAISRINWMQPYDFQLIIGTPSGVLTAQASSLGDALQPDNVVIRKQDARGTSDCLPVNVADSLLFAHVTGRRLQGIYAKDTYGRLGAQDLSLGADTLITGRIRQIAWQDYPHGIAWVCMTDGRWLSLTLQPEEKIQGMFPQQLGGRFVNGGKVEHPHVESLCVIPSPDGEKTDLWLLVKRTIDGATVRYVEVMRPFWVSGTDPRDAWFLDCALKYDGNDDETKLLALSEPAEGGPNASWTVTLSGFTTTEFDLSGKLSIYDGRRWHRGTVTEITDSTHMEWLPAAPNAPPAASDGVRWFWDSDNEEWTQPEEDAVYDRGSATYEQPETTSGIWQWSKAVDDFSGIDHLEGEEVQALIDGYPSLKSDVSSGAITPGGEGSIVLIGLPYNSDGTLLPLTVGSQKGDASNSQRPIYSLEIQVFETWGLQSGTGVPSDYQRKWQFFEDTVFPQPFAEGEPPLMFTGIKPFARDSQGSVDDPKAAFRHASPLPCFVLSVISRFNQSDGR